MKIKAVTLLICAVLGSSLAYGQRKKELKFIDENVRFATAQTAGMLESVGEPNGKRYPRTTNSQGKLVCTSRTDWTPGFFPGSLWYLYELTGDAKWKTEAEKWTATLEPLKTFTAHHDLGFMMYCSYGNAERLAPKPEYKDILVESANSLLTRFSEKTGSIKSWNRHRVWDGETFGDYPVIIDNMMNIEMLFYAYRVTGDKKYYDAAVSHADNTLKNHVREDFTTYHVVNYDPETGEVVYRVTTQGYSDNSTWARGQAWAIYGFTMSYRETKDEKYLSAAKKMADYFIDNLPADFVPYWDFNVGQEGYVPGKNSYVLNNPLKLRDASAAAIAASGMLELAGITSDKSYRSAAVKILHSLSSPVYRARLGENGNFILMHSVGSLPHKGEIDVPLVYADYYFLEALTRYKKLLSK